jgi:hypothetical protein
MPKTPTYQEALAGAERAAQRVEKWPDWMKEWSGIMATKKKRSPKEILESRLGELSGPARGYQFPPDAIEFIKEADALRQQGANISIGPLVKVLIEEFQLPLKHHAVVNRIKELIGRQVW